MKKQVIFCILCMLAGAATALTQYTISEKRSTQKFVKSPPGNYSPTDFFVHSPYPKLDIIEAKFQNGTECYIAVVPYGREPANNPPTNISMSCFKPTFR